MHNYCFTNSQFLKEETQILTSYTRKKKKEKMRLHLVFGRLLQQFTEKYVESKRMITKKFLELRKIKNLGSNLCLIY